jgi:hypothetical protein
MAAPRAVLHNGRVGGDGCGGGAAAGGSMAVLCCWHKKSGCSIKEQPLFGLKTFLTHVV